MVRHRGALAPLPCGAVCTEIRGIWRGDVRYNVCRYRESDNGFTADAAMAVSGTSMGVYPETAGYVSVEDIYVLSPVETEITGGLGGRTMVAGGITAVQPMWVCRRYLIL